MTTVQNGKPGLRERKKARTRAALQDAALRLYLQQGYHETTVEQIADAAEVSPATFFRYFPTKPETVLYDRLDPLFLESFVQQPAELSVIPALRVALHDVLDSLSAQAQFLEETRVRLVAEVPELRAALANRLESDSRMFAEAVATRLGRNAGDFDVMVFVGAILGGLVAAFAAAIDDPEADLMGTLDRGLDHLNDGLLREPTPT